MSIKFLLLGGVFWVWEGGGSADFIFMGARIFLKSPVFLRSRCTCAASGERCLRKNENKFLHSERWGESFWAGTSVRRPGSLLLSLGGAIQTLAWVLSWARPAPIPSPRWSRPDSPCAKLFHSVLDPSRSRGGGHPVHPGPSWSHLRPERSFQDRAWTGRNRLLGHFQICPDIRPDVRGLSHPKSLCLGCFSLP